MAFQFKIQLARVDHPPVWRRVVVPEHFTFFRFHKVIQEAFGWENAHLFQFSPEGWGSQPAIGLKFDDMDGDEATQDSKRIKLAQVFDTPGQTYTYLYDFGDDWLHALWLEARTDEKLSKADLLEGEGRCPPEDCGGFPGYEELKRVLADPSNPEHEEMREWAGLDPRQPWNPSAFDLEKAKARVRRV